MKGIIHKILDGILTVTVLPPEPPVDLVQIDYTNWRGERRKRLIRPESITFKATDYHPTPQWILRAQDGDGGITKDFAMSEIHSWEPASVDAKRAPATGNPQR